MDVLLNLSESCKLMRVCYSKGQKIAKSGQLPFKKIGGTWVIPKSKLYAALGLEPDDKDPGETRPEKNK